MADGGQAVVVEVRRVPVTAADGFAEAALAHWGAWLRAGGALGQGYARETPEGRLRREGACIRGTRGYSGRTPDDALAERVDRIVARLAADDPRWPLMLRWYYGGGSEATHQSTAERLADRYGERVTDRHVRDWLRLAVATVRGALREVLS